MQHTRTNAPFVAMEFGGLKKSFIDGNKTCWIDHSSRVHAFSASATSSCSISFSVMTTSSPVTPKITPRYFREITGDSANQFQAGIKSQEMTSLFPAVPTVENKPVSGSNVMFSNLFQPN